MRIPHITSALSELKPNAEWTLRGDTYAGLEWLDKNQTKPTEEEVNLKVAELEKGEPMKLLRVERNKLIAETDWTQANDIPFSTLKKQEWQIYRQQLRDLPANSSPKLDSNYNLDLTSVTWPTPPS